MNVAFQLTESALSVVPSTARGTGSFNAIWPWLLVLLGVVLAGGIVIGLIRRWMRTGDTAPTIGFTLSDLRTLQAEGRISKEELERAEHAMIKRVRMDADPANPQPISPKPTDKLSPQPESGPEHAE